MVYFKKKSILGVIEKYTWSWRKQENKNITFPEAFTNAATISNTDVPFPVPKLYTSQPGTYANSTVRLMKYIHNDHITPSPSSFIRTNVQVHKYWCNMKL